MLSTLVVQGCFHSNGGGGNSGPTNAAPVFTSGTEISVVEATTMTGYTAMATDADGDVVTFSLSGGTDQEAFSIDSDSGVLSFIPAPDFEDPNDSDGNNQYVVDITASDGTASVVQKVTVTVLAGADPTGYYTNSGFVDVKAGDNTTQRLVQDLQGMVHNGQLMMLSDTENLAYIGTFTVSGNDFSGSVTLYEAGVMVAENVPVDGMITAQAKITGTLRGTGAANGSFQLDYAADNGPVTLETVARLIRWRRMVNSDDPNDPKYPNTPNNPNIVSTLNLQDTTELAPDPNFGGGAGGAIGVGVSLVY